MEQAAPRREYGIDLVKTLAIFGVIVIHACKYNYDLLSFPWTSSVFWGCLVRASVPLFFMCSGALFLAKDRPFSAKKLFTRSIPRILIAMFVWAMAYKVYHLIPAGVTVSGLFQAVKEVLVYNQEFHLYYLQIILIVYLFLPLTRLVVEHASRRQLQYLLALWFLFGIVYPTVGGFWPFTLLTGMAPQYKINMTYAAIGYGVLGYYLKTYPAKRWVGIAEAAGGFALVFGGTLLLSVRDGGLNTLFLEGMSVGVAVLAAGIFRLCTAMPPKRPGVRKAVVFVSRGSFCVYLCHVFWLYLVARVGLTAELLPPIWAVPVTAAVILVLSLAVYWVLSHIPVVNKWLI